MTWQFRKQEALKNTAISFSHIISISLIILERYSSLTNILQDIIIVIMFKRFKEPFLQKNKERIDCYNKWIRNLSFQKKIFKSGYNFPSAMKNRITCLLLKLISEDLESGIWMCKLVFTEEGNKKPISKPTCNYLFTLRSYSYYNALEYSHSS